MNGISIPTGFTAGLIRTIHFYGSVAASSRLTLVSQRLNFPYIIAELLVIFRVGQNELLQVTSFITQDPSAPTTEPPTGTQILDPTSQTQIIRGDGNENRLAPHSLVTGQGTFLKVHGNNTDAVNAHILDASMQVLQLIPVPPEE